MNAFQRLWWEQARADHGVLLLLRRQKAEACHQLHYLQMVTEKLGKAYFWRSGRPPRMSHASFVRFLQALDDRPSAETELVAACLGFARGHDLGAWIRSVAPLAYEMERLAPRLAGPDGPNAEYPWPHSAPAQAPINFPFPIWTSLVDTGSGRQLLRVIDAAVRNFPQYA
jgi:hypothetical protein